MTPFIRTFALAALTFSGLAGPILAQNPAPSARIVLDRASLDALATIEWDALNTMSGASPQTVSGSWSQSVEVAGTFDPAPPAFLPVFRNGTLNGAPALYTILQIPPVPRTRVTSTITLTTASPVAGVGADIQATLLGGGFATKKVFSGQTTMRAYDEAGALLSSRAFVRAHNDFDQTKFAGVLATSRVIKRVEIVFEASSLGSVSLLLELRVGALAIRPDPVPTDPTPTPMPTPTPPPAPEIPVEAILSAIASRSSQSSLDAVAGAMTSRASQSSVDVLNSKVITMSSMLAALPGQANLDALGVAIQSGVEGAIQNGFDGSRQALATAVRDAVESRMQGLLQRIESLAQDEAGRELRATIDQSLSDGTPRVWFVLPASVGGQFESVRTYLDEVIVAAQTAGANVTRALRELARGDEAAAAGNYSAAFAAYAGAYGALR